MTETRRSRGLPVLAACLALCVAASTAWGQGRAAVRNGDYIVAVVNQELVTAGEVDLRVSRAREGRRAQSLPPELEMRREALDALIDERVVITYARDSGMRIDDAEVDRAVQNVATQNQLSVEQLRERLRSEGLDMPRFRANLRDQLLVERVREREVYPRIRVTDAEIDAYLQRQQSELQADVELNIAQILVTVADGASAAQVAERQARAQAALDRVRGGEAFDKVAREVSEDSNRERGGEIGARATSRLPDPFVDAVRALRPGEVAPALLRSGAGFHALKLLDRRDAPALRVNQTRARHILLRLSDRLSAATATQRLEEYRRQIQSGRRSFEDLAKEFSEDGSAAAGGDLGWTGPGAFVPEFEEAITKLEPGAISPPVVSRFGVHLIQVLERRQVAVEAKALREQARSALREQKFEQAHADWSKDLRTRAYIEMREPPI